MDFLFEEISKLKKYWLLFIIFVLFIVINDLFLLHSFKSNKKDIDNNIVVKNNESDEINEEKNIINVDIKGEVKKPGVYKVDNSMIVNDVIKLAGGLKKGATTSNINLSKKLYDQMVIIISSKSKVNRQIKQNEIVLKNDAIITNGASADISDTTDNLNNTKLVNINSASETELLSLTGIGESKAKAIISYREKTRFNSIEDIKNVSGIGNALFEQIKNSITV